VEYGPVRRLHAAGLDRDEPVAVGRLPADRASAFLLLTGNVVATYRPAPCRSAKKKEEVPMMTSPSAYILIAAAVATVAPPFAACARADETTFCNFFITAVPYVISAQGHYCFDRNLSTAIPSGNAITINSDFVVLDLNNFKLGGGGAGPNTQTNGVYALNHRNITIRNGNIRGFFRAIFLDDNSGSGTSGGSYLVENVVADQNTFHGIEFVGTGAVIRNNQVVSNGGSALSDATGNQCMGVYFKAGAGAQIIDNTILDVKSGTALGGMGYGIYSSGGHVTVEHNLVTGASMDDTSQTGIRVDPPSASVQALVMNNRVMGVYYGIVFGTCCGAYRDNASTASASYTGGTNFGNNQ
jgi:hypothetical protein